MFSKTISQDAARTFMATSKGIDEIDITDSELEGYMTSRGYIYDAFTKEFKATEDTLKWFNN